MPPPLPITPREIQTRRDVIMAAQAPRVTVIVMKADAKFDKTKEVYLVKDTTPSALDDTTQAPEQLPSPPKPKKDKAGVWKPYSYEDLGLAYGLPVATEKESAT